MAGLTHKAQLQSLAAVLAIITVFCTPPSYARGARDYFPHPWGKFVILAKVLSVHKNNASQLITDYSYRVEVLAECRDRIRPGTDCRINGPRAYIRTGSVFIPIMRAGTYFVMCVYPAKKPGVLRYHSPSGLPNDWFPVGVELPSPVAKGEVAKLKTAILEFGKAWKAGIVPTDANAVKLRQSRNYFLWALGTWVLSKSATHRRVNRWEVALGSYSFPGFPNRWPMLSPRRAFWLVHCMRRVVPAKVRPSAAELSDALTGYLRRLATPPVPGYTY